MKLVSMEIAPPKVEEVTNVPTGYGSYDKFPYGLRITLNNAAIDKLNINMSEFQVNETVKLVAEAVIIRVSDEAAIESGSQQSRSIELQITDIAIEPSQEQDFQKAFDEATDINEKF